MTFDDSLLNLFTYVYVLMTKFYARRLNIFVAKFNNTDYMVMYTKDENIYEVINIKHMLKIVYQTFKIYLVSLNIYFPRYGA